MFMLISRYNKCLSPRSIMRLNSHLIGCTSKYSNVVADSELSDGNTAKILEVVNTCGSEGIPKYKLSRTRSKKIVAYRDKHGAFCSMDQILQIDGLDEKFLKKFSDSILKIDNSGSLNEMATKIRGQFITPALTNVDKLTSVVGVHMGSNCISWAKLMRANTAMSHWEYFSLDDFNKQKLSLVDILQMVIRLMQRIPPADVYIFEAAPSSLQSSQKMQIMSMAAYQKNTQLTCMLLTLLNTSPFHNNNSIFKCVDSEMSDSNNTDTDISQNIYFLRAQLPARFFRTLVGNETVSTAQTVTSIIEAKHQIRVEVESKIKEFYNSLHAVHKEILGQALLLTLTFMELCLHQTSTSIKDVGKENPST